MLISLKKNIMPTNRIDAIQQVQKLDQQFSRNQYNGGGQNDFVIKEGSIPVMISAPHSINHFRKGQLKLADKMTGGIALYLHQLTGCHVIYSARYTDSDPNYDAHTDQGNPYQTQLKEYIEQHNIEVLIDLHGAAIGREYALEMSTAPMRDSNGNVVGNENRSLHQHHFIADLIRYTFEHVLRDLSTDKKEIWQNKIFSAAIQNTITKYISEHTHCPCVQIEINAIYRDVNHPSEFSKMLEGLSYIIQTLGNLDWTAKQIAVFRLWQSINHKPQDKVEVCDLKIRKSGFKENSLLYLCSSSNTIEMVRLHPANARSIHHLHEGLRDDDQEVSESKDQEYLFLTNRLIENLFSREWIQGTEEKAFLRGAPIILYENDKDIYQIGLPKANQLDGVSFSSELYQSKLPNADHYDFVVFNRYTDSRFYIDFTKADYQDHGRVKDATGKPAMKVMIPRYYKRLLGYLNKPLLIIRHEEFLNLQQRIKDDIHIFLADIYQKGQDGYRLSIDKLNQQKIKGLIDQILSDTKTLFNAELSEDDFSSLEEQLCADMTQPLLLCYEKLAGEVFYRLKEDIQSDEHHQKALLHATDIQKYYGLYDSIEILRIPKRTCKNVTLRHKFYKLVDKAVVGMLKKIIGNVEYSLRTEWTSETDDKNNVARLSPNMMSLIGVSENDKIRVQFGEKKEVLRVLAKQDLSDFQIGLPAPTRKRLGMNSINDIALVSRDMKHAFKRHSQEQTIAIIGMILAVFQVTDNLLLGTLLCIIFTPLVLYFVLNEERVKVK